MRRVIILGTALVLIGVLVNRAQAHEPHTSSNQIERREKQCRYQWMDKGTWTPREEWRTARCVTDRWAVPGGLTTFLRIGHCESGYSRLAWNPSGPYVGIYQHDLSSWTYRLDSYEPEWWALRPRWQNSRTMITISARMMAAVGLSPWTCA